MKKSLFVAAIAAIALVACKKTETETAAEATVDSAAAVVDSAANVVDTASTATVADSAAAAATGAAVVAVPVRPLMLWLAGSAWPCVLVEHHGLHRPLPHRGEMGYDWIG